MNTDRWQPQTRMHLWAFTVSSLASHGPLRPTDADLSIRCHDQAPFPTLHILRFEKLKDTLEQHLPARVAEADQQIPKWVPGGKRRRSEKSRSCVMRKAPLS